MDAPRTPGVTPGRVIVQPGAVLPDVHVNPLQVGPGLGPLGFQTAQAQNVLQPVQPAQVFVAPPVGNPPNCVAPALYPQASADDAGETFSTTVVNLTLTSYIINASASNTEWFGL